MTKAVYTCITDGYDLLQEPGVKSAGWDYICFTNNPNLKSRIWRFVLIKDKSLSAVKIARKIKILFASNKISNYDINVWVDGNIKVNCDLNSILNKYLPAHADMAIMNHYSRKCIYQEARACAEQKKDKPVTIFNQITRYRKEGYPANNGMVASRVMIRRNNNRVIKLMADWWKEVFEGSHRDQLSFNYALYKNQKLKLSFIPHSLTKREFKKFHHCK